MGWWGNLFRRMGQDRELEREIAFHIEELTQSHVAAGMPPEEARRQALLEFGGHEQVKQELREVYLWAPLEAMRFHLRAAMRFLRRSPSFSLIVIVILGIGIGANSAVFSAMDAVVLQPLPYPRSEELLMLHQHDRSHHDANTFVAPVRLEDWNRMSSTFQGISGYYMDDMSETTTPMPQRVEAAFVAPRFLPVMGVAPILGRNFTQREEHFGGPEAALISYRFWQTFYHGDPAAVGRKLHVGGFSFSIIGVMPESFVFPVSNVDLWTPSPPDAPYAQSRSETWFQVVGRMKPGVAERQALADLNVVQARLGREYPKTDADLNVQGMPLKATVVSGGIRDSLWLLYGSVSLLLLIACSNIAALLLARTSDREHEMSVRFAMGASRRSLVMQLLSEVLVLAFAGALLGLLIAALASQAFHLLANTLPRAQEITLNWRIVLYSLFCALGTTLLCGLFPALRGTRQEIARSLARTSRTQVSTRSTMPWVLVGVQIMLAVTLLTGAGLLLQSLWRLDRVAPGFDPAHVLTFQVTGSWAESTDRAALQQHVNTTLDELRALPGVKNAAASGMLPGLAPANQTMLFLDGNTDPNRKIMADVRYVSAGYFQTMLIPLFQGHACREGAKTADLLVNHSFAAMYLGDGPAAGHEIEASANNIYSLQGQVTGVVGDAREEGVNVPPVPTVYECMSAPNPFPHYLVRTQGDPAAMANTVRQLLHRMEPNRSVYNVASLEQELGQATFEDRLRTVLLSLFAASAVLLACLGIYGTLNYLGRLRQREVGVRLAMGAMRGQILRRFLLQGLRVTALGCVAGFLVSLGTNRMIQDMLYGVSTQDPVTYVAVLAFILLVAVAASFIPAWRASRVEPVRVLRQE